MASTLRPASLLRRALADRRLAIMLLLGFGSGLPIVLVFATLSAWLRSVGVERSSIGLLSYVSLAYSLKFVWAPAVDRLDVPVLARWLGRRRAWMLTTQLVVAAGLLAMSRVDPAAGLGLTAGLALLVAFASATQDVVVDGWRIDAAPAGGDPARADADQGGLMLAAYQLGYAVARVFSGAGALLVADWAGWSTAYAAMCALMGVGIAGCLAAPRVGADASREAGLAATGAPRTPARRGLRRAAREAVVEPLADLARRRGAGLAVILALITLYRLPDIVSGIMANPLYLDTGFTLTEIAGVSKLYGVWVGLAGALVGGVAVTRLGLMPTLLVGGIAGSASNLGFAWLAVRGHDLTALIAVISIENFAGAFAGTALIAYMSSLVSPTHAATQYALLSSLYALPGKLVGGWSGFAVDAFGYPTFFALTSSVGILVAILCLAIRALPPERRAPPAARSDPTLPAAAAAGS